MTKTGKNKLVIIPAYNEEGAIVNTVEDIKKNAPSFDYIIINDMVDNCVKDINGIISGSADTVEKCLTANNINRVNQIKKELEKFSKGE